MHQIKDIVVRAVVVAVFSLCVRPLPAAAQSADNVLVVVNDSSPASQEIGAYYAEKRAVPADHIVHIKTDAKETVQRTEFDAAIEQPIGAYLTVHALQDKVLYIVLTKGVPLRVFGTGGREGTVASVDSELTLLYRKLLHQPVPMVGHIPNPYFLGDKKTAEAQMFTRFNGDIYLVTRLDGFSTDDVKALVDRGVNPITTGKIVLDQKDTLIDAGGDRWLEEAADRLGAEGGRDRTTLESTRAIATTTEPVIGYYSWGSNDPANQLRDYGFTFSPGAIGGMFVSTDARTFAEPPATWKPSNPAGGPTFGGSFQSLTGNLIREGITGVAGHVEEPFLDATIRPQILFPAYLAGFNLAEAFYLAMPYVSWQTVVIGDPLCTPFPRKTVAPEGIAKGFDADSQMPMLFTERRLAQAGAGLNPAALKLELKLEVEIAKGIQDNFESTLVKATTIEPKLVEAHLVLAAYYGRKGDYEHAAERFKRVVEVAPTNVVALNDLAYTLADELKRPQEALPYAERALQIAQTPDILDTYGWTQHLLGQNDRGIDYIERALRGAPGQAEILLHAAIMHTALGQKITARSELASALKAEPKFADRDDVKALQAALK